MASRVVVKNLPKHATDERLRDFFSAIGEVTDARLQKTKEGKSRQFAFIGYRNEKEAKEAVKQLNKSFFDTQKISVEFAHAPGSEKLAEFRPWSKYAAGSSGYKKREEKGEDKVAPAPVAEKNKGPAFKQSVNVKASSVKSVNVKASKAGVSSQRTHVEFDESSVEEMDDEEDENDENDDPQESDISRTKLEGDAAFDDGLDDLSYLRAKTRAKENDADAAAVAGPEALKADSTGNKKKKKIKKKEGLAASDLNAGADGQGMSVDGIKDAAEIPAGDDVAEPRDEEAEMAPDVSDTGRLFITNLPYGATEDELRAHFEVLGDVASTHVVKDEDTLKSRGFGYISYVFPECAARAISELDLQSFQGRLLRINAARTKPQSESADGATASSLGGGSSYKRQKEQQRKKVEAHQQQTWNLLYVSAAAAADVASAQLGVAKSELFGKDSTGAAVTAALTETSVIQQTKQWLKREGIRIEAFEQAGPTLMKSRAASDGETKRREDAFIVKHLPAGASAVELRDRFARHGELIRCSVAPSGTVAIVQYSEKGMAKRAFEKMAFSRFRHVPLYLEWAPELAFESEKPQEEPSVAATTAGKGGGEEEGGEGVDEDTSNVLSLFVKNLSFETTDETLKAAFRGCKGLRAATVMRKKAAVTKAGAAPAKGLSMGYGFVEFASAALATEALKRKQGAVVDGHTLALQISQRGGRAQPKDGAVSGGKKIMTGTITGPRICVRNIAFETTGRELRELFGAYGSVTAVRMPKKSDYTGHRGFAFIDFAAKAEAAAAFEALQHTHLYGRRLVIEPAEEKDTDISSIQQETQKRQANHTLKSEATKRRRAGVLDGGKGDNSFEDAMIA